MSLWLQYNDQGESLCFTEVACLSCSFLSKLYFYISICNSVYCSKSTIMSESMIFSNAKTHLLAPPLVKTLFYINSLTLLHNFYQGLVNQGCKYIAVFSRSLEN